MPRVLNRPVTLTEAEDLARWRTGFQVFMARLAEPDPDAADFERARKAGWSYKRHCHVCGTERSFLEMMVCPEGHWYCTNDAPVEVTIGGGEDGRCEACGERWPLSLAVCPSPTCQQKQQVRRLLRAVKEEHGPE